MGRWPYRKLSVLNPYYMFVQNRVLYNLCIGLGCILLVAKYHILALLGRFGPILSRFCIRLSVYLYVFNTVFCSVYTQSILFKSEKFSVLSVSRETSWQNIQSEGGFYD